MKTILLIWTGMLLLFPSATYSQTDGTLDTTFNKGSGATGGVGQMILLSDGKFLICGPFSKFDNVNRNGIARLDFNGSIDTTFKPGQGALFGIIRSMVQQSDGKFVLGGSFTNYDNHYSSRLARIFPDGSYDSTLDASSGVSGELMVLALQPDGKILIGGDFTSYNGKPKRNLARIFPTGRLDTTFITGTGPNNGTSASLVNDIKVLPDGKILVAGAFLNYNGTARKHMVRLNSDGSIDTNFNPRVGASAEIGYMLPVPGDKILISGYFNSYAGKPAPRIARILSNGSLDTTFNFNMGTTAPSYITRTMLLPAGKILVTGQKIVLRLHPDGTKDSSFNNGTNGVTQDVGNCIMQADSRVIISGNFTSYNGMSRNGIARLNGLIAIGINETAPLNSAEVLVYPNPFENRIHFESKDNLTGAHLMLFNAQGNRVEQGDFENGSLYLDLKDKSSGIYFYRILRNNQLIKAGKIWKD